MKIGDKVKLSFFGKVIADIYGDPQNSIGTLVSDELGYLVVDWGIFSRTYTEKEIEIVEDNPFKTKIMLCPVKVGHVEVTKNGKVWVNHFDTKEELEEIIMTLNKLKEVMS